MLIQLSGFRQSNRDEQMRTLPAESTPRFLAVEATAEELVGGEAACTKKTETVS